MTLVVAVAGIVGGLVGWPLLRPALTTPALIRTNHRGDDIVTAGGLVLVLVALAAAVVVSVAGVWTQPAWVMGGVESLGPAAAARATWTAALVAVLGFALLGFVDDAAAAGRAGGFRGHVTAMGHGQLTTGGLKLLGGAAGAVTAVAMAGRDRPLVLIGDALIVALAANLANLLDLRPARTTKAALAAWLGLLAVGGLGVALHPASLVVGAAVGLLVPELREEVMLGDTGSNVVGACLGLTAVAVLGGPARIVVAVVLVVLNASSEVVSFSTVIERVAPLRWLDGLGRG